MEYVLIGFLSYLIGCFTAAYFIGKLYKVDVRMQGSGNPGTTNALRVLGAKAGIITLVLDALKGVFACWLGSLIEPIMGAYVAATMVVLGHNFPFHLQFKGGKGVATSAGILLYFSPLVLLLCIVAFLALSFLSKRVSIGSIGAAFLAPFITWLITNNGSLTRLVVFLALLLIVRHRPNIERLLRGEEPPFTLKGKKS